MISLGSCTMKLNAAALMQPLSLAGFQMMHPFAPADQAEGYMQLIKELKTTWRRSRASRPAPCNPIRALRANTPG